MSAVSPQIGSVREGVWLWVLCHRLGSMVNNLTMPDPSSDRDPALHSKAGCWDIMSDTFRAGSFLGWHRHKNGWLEPSRTLYINQCTSAWYVTLSPLSGGCGISMIVLPVDDPIRPSKVFVIELAPPVLGLHNNPQPAKGILVYTVDATVRDQQSPLVIMPKTTTNNNEYGPLCEAAHDVGDDVSVVMGGVSLGVKVIQKIGDCYHIS